MGGFFTTGDLVCGFAFPLGAHPREVGIKVLVGQVRLFQTHVDDVDAQGPRKLACLIANTAHQDCAVRRQDGVGRHLIRTQNLSDLRVQDTFQTILGRPDAANAYRLAELLKVCDPVTCEGVNHQTAIIGRCHLDLLRVQRQNTVIIANDLLDQRDLERQTGFFLDRFDLAELKDQCLFAFIHDEDRGQNGRHGNCDQRDENVCSTHQLFPPVDAPLRNSLSGR